MNNIFKSFKFKLISYVVIIVLILISISSMLTINIVSNSFHKQLMKNTISSFEKTQIEINNIFAYMDKTIANIYSSNEMDQFLDTKGKSVLELIEDSIAMKRMLDISKYLYIDAFCIVTPDKRVLSSQKTFTIVNKDDYINGNLYSNILRENPTFSEMEFSKLTDYKKDTEKIIFYSKKLIYYSGKECKPCVVLVGIFEQNFKDVYSHLQQASNTITIIDKNGIQLSSTSADGLGNKLPYFDLLTNSPESFNYSIDNIEEQIITYRLDSQDWIIINQVPTTEFKGDINKIKTIVIKILILCILGISIICAYLISKMSRPFYKLDKVMKSFSSGDLSARIDANTKIAEFDTLNSRFNSMADSINELIKQQKFEQEQKNKFKMQSLLSQINPHFLFNTLNIIKWMSTIGGNTNITNILQSLMNILAPTFINHKSFWSLREEFEFLNNYINILNIRYGANVVISLNIDENLLEHNVPRFIIQPLLENSITHGFVTNRVLHVNIDVLSENNELKIIVSDNGSGMNHQRVQEIESKLASSSILTDLDIQNSIGLANIKQRLNLYFPGRNDFFFESHIDKGTAFIIMLPLQL